MSPSPNSRRPHPTCAEGATAQEGKEAEEEEEEEEEEESGLMGRTRDRTTEFHAARAAARVEEREEGEHTAEMTSTSGRCEYKACT